ncbi:hypothetical protein AAVH_10951 [Aphelenchoides avenae]|nr:hypothetical protein AAVH_10951 [Aphelenchus avenae]
MSPSTSSTMLSAALFASVFAVAAAFPYPTIANGDRHWPAASQARSVRDFVELCLNGHGPYLLCRPQSMAKRAVPFASSRTIDSSHNDMLGSNAVIDMTSGLESAQFGGRPVYRFIGSGAQYAPVKRSNYDYLRFGRSAKRQADKKSTASSYDYIRFGKRK